MSVTKERFEEGLTYDAYKEQMTRNQDRFASNEATVDLVAADVDFFTQLPQTLNVLVLAEDWCGDVINNLPVLGRLAAVSRRLNVRVFLRDQNLDLIDQYLKDGQFRAIPVFVFFDENFRELGHWIERPARIYTLQAEFRSNLFATDALLANIAPDTSPSLMPEAARNRLTQALGDFRAEHRIETDHEVVRELRAIVESSLA